MEILKHAIIRQWGFILLAVLSVVTSLVTKLPIWWLALVSIIIILVNEAMEVRRSHQQKRLEIAFRIKELAEDFRRRFVSLGSSLSIFHLINDLGSTRSEKQQLLREWADGCILGQDFLEHGLHNFSGSSNLVIQHRASNEQELSERCEEFQRMNHSYYKFVEEFYKRAEVANIPKNLEESYNNGFVVEYNEFVRIVRDTMSQARQMLHLSVEPKSIDFAKELRIARWG